MVDNSSEFLEELMRFRSLKEKILAFIPTTIITLISYNMSEITKHFIIILFIDYLFLFKFLKQDSFVLLIIFSFLVCCVILVLKRNRYYFSIMKFVTINSNNMPNVVLKPWTSEWENEFLIEKERIEKSIRPNFERFFLEKEKGLIHIGSTSIKNITLAKPHHDMAIYWNSNENLPKEFIEEMEKIGYMYFGPSPHCVNGRNNWFFNKNSKIDYGYDLHVTQPLSHSWLDECKLFIDYLSTFPKEKDIYQKVKEKYNNSKIHIYAFHKDQVYLELIDRAKKWQKTILNKKD